MLVMRKLSRQYPGWKSARDQCLWTPRCPSTLHSWGNSLRPATASSHKGKPPARGRDDGWSSEEKGWRRSGLGQGEEGMCDGATKSRKYLLWTLKASSLQSSGVISTTKLTALLEARKILLLLPSENSWEELTWIDFQDIFKEKKKNSLYDNVCVFKNS